MTRLSHKCRKLRDLVLPLFQVLELSTLNFINPFNVSFSCYNTYYFIYSRFKKYLRAKKRERERERERVNAKKSMTLAFVLGAYDLNLSTISKPDTMLQRYFTISKRYVYGRHRAFIRVICFYLYFWEVLNLCK